MSEEELRKRWPNADRVGMIDQEGEVHGFDRVEDGEEESEEEEAADE